MSTSVTRLAMAVACISPTTSLLYWGKARLSALGNKMRRYKANPSRPKLRAASISPALVALIAPAKISVV
jgi:hypothetical protein